MSDSPRNPRPHENFGAPPARILVVDDDAFTCALYASILEHEGYEVMTSDDGADALNELAFDSFDLVLADRRMPFLDGATMVLALRDSGSRVPIVMMSHAFENTPLPQSVAREVSAVLPKPASRAEIVEAVREALRATTRGHSEESSKFLLGHET